MPTRQRKRTSIMPSAPGSGHTSATIARALVPGMTIAGRYRVGRRIAAGGMGEVWEGLHTELRLRVALKTLRRDVCADQEVVARFSREAFLMGRIQSDHVARVLDFVADKKIGPILVMEFIEGMSLASLLDSKRLTIEEAIELGINLATGLRELHRARVVHRDVKPANIILRPSSEGGHRPVFVDLGVGRMVSDGEPRSNAEDELDLTDITSWDRAVGTAEYMAPEQILTSRNVTAAADLYAVGAILYRAVSGRHAFGTLNGFELLKSKLSHAAPPLETGRSDRVATGFQEVVARALSPSPNDRYEVADEMLADLSLLRDTSRRARQSVERNREPVRTSASKSYPRADTRSRARWWPLAVTAIVFLAVGLLLGRLFARRTTGPMNASAAHSFDAERCTITVDSQSPNHSFAIVCAPNAAPPPGATH